MMGMAEAQQIIHSMISTLPERFKVMNLDKHSLATNFAAGALVLASPSIS